MPEVVPSVEMTHQDDTPASDGLNWLMTFIKEDWSPGAVWMYRNTEFPNLRRELIEHNDPETRAWVIGVIDHMDGIVQLLTENT